MSHYKLYCLDARDKITKAHWIQADSDEEALAIACAMGLDSDCELWLGARKVARIVDGQASMLPNDSATQLR
ncbi:hypothetical protein ACFQPG_01255 [Sphingomonas sp. GCM10030256]|uniref:hypothetical protein n=1 Tax=Sphingomonas sp. GCM10030256 TaxID=3273427 RepID=UPI00360FC698